MTRMKQLSKRKAEMERMLAEGKPLPEYQAYLPEAEQDPDLAIHYYLRDTIIKLKKLRKEKGISQEEMAEKMGTKQAAISRFETYSGEPGLKFLLRYILALQENPDNYLPCGAGIEPLKQEFLIESHLLEGQRLMEKIRKLQIPKKTSFPSSLIDLRFACGSTRG